MKMNFKHKRTLGGSSACSEAFAISYMLLWKGRNGEVFNNESIPAQSMVEYIRKSIEESSAVWSRSDTQLRLNISDMSPHDVRFNDL